MLGDDILVKVLVDIEAEYIYLPAGDDWIDFDTFKSKQWKKAIAGGQMIKFDARE